MAFPAEAPAPTNYLRVRGSRALLVALACFVVMLPAVHAEERHIQRGDVNAFVWTPSNAADVLLPVVIFSHGISMCANQSRFITEALAAAGYLVIAPNHADAHCSVHRSHRAGPSTPGETEDSDQAGRAHDVLATLEYLATDADLAARADLSRVALAGHSFGGYTALAIVSARRTSNLPPVRAVLVFAPFTLPFAAGDELRELDVPVMYQVGALDPIFTLPVAGFGGAYDRTPPPKYYVEMAGAGHLAWIDGPGLAKQAIVDYAIAFLDRYLKGVPESAILKRRPASVAAVRRDVGSN